LDAIIFPQKYILLEMASRRIYSLMSSSFFDTFSDIIYFSSLVQLSREIDMLLGSQKNEAHSKQKDELKHRQF